MKIRKYILGALIVIMAQTAAVLAQENISQLRQEYHQLKVQLYAAQKSKDRQKVLELKSQLDLLLRQIKKADKVHS